MPTMISPRLCDISVSLVPIYSSGVRRSARRCFSSGSISSACGLHHELAWFPQSGSASRNSRIRRGEPAPQPARARSDGGRGTAGGLPHTTRMDRRSRSSPRHRCFSQMPLQDASPAMEPGHDRADRDVQDVRRLLVGNLAMSTRTITSRKSCGTAASASTMLSCERRSRTRSSSVDSSESSERRLYRK